MARRPRNHRRRRQEQFEDARLISLYQLPWLVACQYKVPRYNTLATLNRQKSTHNLADDFCVRQHPAWCPAPAQTTDLRSRSMAAMSISLRTQTPAHLKHVHQLTPCSSSLPLGAQWPTYPCWRTHLQHQPRFACPSVLACSPLFSLLLVSLVMLWESLWRAAYPCKAMMAGCERCAIAIPRKQICSPLLGCVSSSKVNICKHSTTLGPALLK